MRRSPRGISQAATLAFDSEVRAALERAKSSGDWRYPLAGAASDSEEMSATDWAYWLYKYDRPVERAEKDVPGVLFLHNRSVVRLPDEFKAETRITVGAAGDLMPIDGLELSKNILFERVAGALFDVDISFANLEAPVTEQAVEKSVIAGQDPKNPPIMRNSPAQFATLVRHKEKQFTALNFANNHTFDMGLEGLETTQKFLARNGIISIGSPRTPVEYGAAVVVTKKGIKIGFISATFGLNGNGLPVNVVHRIHTARLTSKHVATDLALLTRQIEDCKKKHCDFIVASMHWGYEFEFFPRGGQIEAAHKLVEAGADLIWGHHPHVIQPLEYYRTKRDPNRIALIAYSLGGLTFSWDAAPHLALGLILTMQLVKGSLDGESRTYLDRIKPIPVFQHGFYQVDTRLLRIEKLEDHLRGWDNVGQGNCGKHISQMKKYTDMVLMNSSLGRP